MKTVTWTNQKVKTVHSLLMREVVRLRYAIESCLKNEWAIGMRLHIEKLERQIALILELAKDLE